jgi:hypothetical protein
MKRWILLSVLLLMMISCKEQKFKKQLDRLTSTEIVILPEIGQVLFGRDTVLIDIGRSPTARLVIYTDSLSCSSCRLKYMYEYNDILGLHEELGEKFVPMFVFSPRMGQAPEIRSTLQLYRFDYPILLDEHGLFPRANPQIPTDARLHTFLLDRDGKVVLVGDPVRNPELWELYKKTITELIENDGTLAQ